MIREVRCENELRELLATDKAAFVREYRNAMHLHGDPAESENVAEEEMIRDLCRDETRDEQFQQRREQWEKTV